MQLIKRGGPEGGPKVGSREEADNGIAALRQAHDAEEASKRAGEAAAAGAQEKGPTPAASAKGGGKKCGSITAVADQEPSGAVQEASHAGAGPETQPPSGW
eukprot:5903206-Pyramimonas_sp.AAC.1